MKTSEWFTVVNDDVITHYHISLAPIIPDEHIDIHLAERLGMIDPFVYEVEHGKNVQLRDVERAIGLWDLVMEKAV